MPEPYGTIARYRRAFAKQKHNKTVDAWAAQAALDTAALFWAQWRGIESRLPKGDEPITSKREQRRAKRQIAAIVGEETAKTEKAMRETLEAHMQGACIAGMAEQARSLGCLERFMVAPAETEQREAEVIVKGDDDGWVSLPNERAARYAEQHAAKTVRGIDETTRAEINRIVADAVANGKAYDEISELIAAKFEQFAVPMPQKHIENRAMLVAVTEMADAYCDGSLQVGRYLESEGVRMMKAWSAEEDSRECDVCRANEAAGWIPIAQRFPSGHDRPPAHPACRCDVFQDMLNVEYLGRGIDEFMDRPIEQKAAAVAELAVPAWSAWNIAGVKRGTAKEQDRFEGNVPALVRDPEKKQLLEDSNMSFDGAPKEQRDAVAAYTGTAYSSINRIRRDGIETFDQAAQVIPGTDDEIRTVMEQSEQLGRFISESGTTSKPIVVNRHVENDFWTDWHEGEVHEVPEFLSATVYDRVFKGGTCIHVYVPPNHGHGVYLDGHSRHEHEAEYLLNAGERYRVAHIEARGDEKHYWLELLV